MDKPFDSLEHNGYALLEDLIPVALLDRFEAQMNALAVKGLQRKGLPVPDTDPFSALLTTGGDYRVRLFANLKHMDVVQEMSREVRARLKASCFLEWAGLEVPVIYPSLRADPPGETTYLLPFHQDYATQCRKSWRLWIPLRDASRETGTMTVVPGSHKLGPVVHDTTDPSRPQIPQDRLQDFDKRCITMQRGNGILFNPLLVHASVPAQREIMKYVLLVQVQDLTTLADADDPDDPLPERLAMRDARDAVRHHDIPKGDA